jgi:hypothetical protein
MGTYKPPRDARNPYKETGKKELSRKCMEYAGELQDRQRRTAKGDDLAFLLIRVAWVLDPELSGPVYRWLGEAGE